MFTIFCHQCTFWKQTNATEGECTTLLSHYAFVGKRPIVPDDLFGILITPPDATCIFVEPKVARGIVDA